jgi:hypothetical protein
MLHLPSGDKMCFDLSPNKHMQRAGRHKVLGRGRSIALQPQVPLARVLTIRRAGADVGRWATQKHHL